MDQPQTGDQRTGDPSGRSGSPVTAAPAPRAPRADSIIGVDEAEDEAIGTPGPDDGAPTDDAGHHRA
jgi:hypothetical protein